MRTFKNSRVFFLLSLLVSFFYACEQNQGTEEVAPEKRSSLEAPNGFVATVKTLKMDILIFQ